MQNAKDTFYEVLRARLIAVNPYRTIALRGVVRPGVLVEENELPTKIALADCFRLRWSPGTVAANGALSTVTMECEINYETVGTLGNGGMDRGRALAAMDGELQALVNGSPRSAQKNNYAALASGGAAVPMSTNVWWGEVGFGKTVVKEDRIAHSATVAVMSFQEAGEV